MPLATTAQNHEADAQSSAEHQLTEEWISDSDQVPSSGVDSSRLEPNRLSLSALIEEAEQTYPSLTACQHAIEAAEAQLGTATVSPFFQGQGTFSFTMAPGARGTAVFSDSTQEAFGNGWGPVYRVGVEGIIPLFTFGKLRHARRAARAGISAAEFGFEQARSELRYNVRRAYFSLQLALDTLQMLSEGTRRLRRAAAKLRQQLEQGSTEVDEIDTYRIEAATAEIEARTSEARRLEESSRSALTTLTGLDEVTISDCPMAKVDVQLSPLQEYVAGVQRRPEFGRLRAAQSALNSQLQIARAQLAPDFVFGYQARAAVGPARTDQENPFVVDRANRNDLGVALVATWSLDLWGNLHRMRRSRAQLAETLAKSEEARRGMELEISTAYYAVTDANRREAAFSEGERQTRRWFVSAGQAYQVGTMSAKDLVDAVQAYFTNRFSHLLALRDRMVALADLERATGAILLPGGGWELPCD